MLAGGFYDTASYPTRGGDGCVGTVRPRGGPDSFMHPSVVADVQSSGTKMQWLSCIRRMIAIWIQFLAPNSASLGFGLPGTRVKMLRQLRNLFEG